MHFFGPFLNCSLYLKSSLGNLKTKAKKKKIVSRKMLKLQIYEIMVYSEGMICQKYTLKLSSHSFSIDTSFVCKFTYYIRFS